MKDIRLPVSVSVDVCVHKGDIIVIRHSGSEVVVEGFDFDLNELGEVLSIKGITTNAGCRIHSWAGVLWIAYRDSFDRGHLVRLDTSEAFELTPMFNAERPFAFGEGKVAWLKTPTLAALLPLGAPLESAGDVHFPDSVATGLSHVSGGNVVTWEDMRTVRPYAVGFAQAGDFLMGEDFANQGLRGEIAGRPGRFILWSDAEMKGPRLALLNDGRAVVIAWASGRQQARIGIISAADLTSDAPPPIPDKPEEPTEPEPEPSMELPARVRELLIQFVAKFPLPQTRGGGEDHENRCRGWCLNFAQQVRFSTGDEAWGVKRAGEGRPQSKDTIAKNIGSGRIAIFDMMLGAGTGAPTLVANPTGEEISDQIFIPVEPINHLGVTPPPPPDDDDDDTEPPPSGDTLALILSELRKLNAHLGVRRVVSQFRFLLARPMPSENELRNSTETL